MSVFNSSFCNLIPSLTVLADVQLVAEIALNPIKPEDALALVGLSEMLDHLPSQFSGREQQRVAVARALVKRHDALFCDEPTGALGVETGKLALAAIARANAEISSTTIVITHSRSIGGMADRALRLSHGRMRDIARNTRKLAAKDLSW
jgi:putative ABC transport system ATP-binding protein